MFFSSITAVSSEKLLAAYCVEVALLAAVETHRLDVNRTHGDDVGTLLGVEVVKVRSVLEVVCQNGAVLYDGVGNDVVVVDLDVKGDALLGKDVRCNLKDLGVRSGGCRNGNGAALECVVVNALVVAVGELVNGGDDGAVVLVGDEVRYLLAFERCTQSLNGVGVLVAFLDCEDVGVCGGGAFLE